MSMTDLSTGYEYCKIGPPETIEINENHNESFTPPGFSRHFHLRRNNILLEDVKKQKLNLMPGFRFSWYYSGMDVQSNVYTMISTPTPIPPPKTYITPKTPAGFFSFIHTIYFSNV